MQQILAQGDGNLHQARFPGAAQHAAKRSDAPQTRDR
jgi:hypothetical protein